MTPSTDQEEIIGYIHNGRPGPLRFSLVADGWAWKRVGRSQVAHLVPPDVLAQSRTACYRLAVYEQDLAAPLGLVTEVRRCQACLARSSGA